MNKRFTAILLALALSTVATGFLGCAGGTSHASGKSDGKSNAKSDGRPETTSSQSLKPEPDVAFKDLQGNRVPLSSLKGKVVLVNFWATYCDPCRIEIPWMIDFQHKYAGQGFTMLGVAMDDEGAEVVTPFVQKTQFDVNGHSMTMNYPIVIGDDDIADKFGGLIGYPTSFLITRDGKIAKKYLGLVSEDELEKEIQTLLGS